MPQIDFESFVPVCVGDPKVACEPEHEPEIPPDFPPESFWLSGDAEFDWFDQNAFLDRKDSAKGNLNPSTNNLCGNNPCSQRFSTRLVSKSSIISLPIKPNPSYMDGSKRRSKKNKTFLPKRNEMVARSLVEPPSPIVSCIGRVRSKRGRRRKTNPEATPDTRAGKAGKRDSCWVGLFQRIMGKFFARRMIKTEPRAQPAVPVKSPSMSSLGAARGEPPSTGLGGMMRFASGRRSASFRPDDFDELTWHTRKIV